MLSGIRVACAPWGTSALPLDPGNVRACAHLLSRTEQQETAKGEHER
jgi:hypothetical protein